MHNNVDTINQLKCEKHGHEDLFTLALCISCYPVPTKIMSYSCKLYVI